MRLRHIIPLLLVTVALTGCNSFFDSNAFSSVEQKMNYPLPTKVEARMRANNMDKYAPITIRIFKEEGVLEIWKQKRDGTYGLLEDYAICAWSGSLGPKKAEGDRQAPEGFYPLSKGLLNPYSKYFLAINTGYPNRYDSANAFSGSNLMIHGACSSAGCYSMTDEQILEIFAFARDAFKGGQQSIMLQAYPFKMTADNMVRHRYNANYDFWQMLKPGYDYFEATGKPAKVDICDRRYVFNQVPKGAGTFESGAACPATNSTVSADDTQKLADFEAKYQQDYQKALKKNVDMVWIDPTEGQRKALVANTRPDPTDALYQPTGPALEAGRYMTINQYRIAAANGTVKDMPAVDLLTETAAIPDDASGENQSKSTLLNGSKLQALTAALFQQRENPEEAPAAVVSGDGTSVAAALPADGVTPTVPVEKTALRAGLPADSATTAAPADIAAMTPVPPPPDVPVSSAVPIPEPSPVTAYAEPAAQQDAQKKPFWKFW